MPERIWFIVAAAGASARFGGPIPKCYQRIAGASVLEHALGALLACPGLAGGVVVLAEGDKRWRRLPAALRRRVLTATGGATRSASVLNGLQALEDAADADWVLVHDAARPCLPASDLVALVSACQDDTVGGLLALPVSDSVKRADDEGRVAGGAAREHLWRAQTPQMFRRGLLLRALKAVGKGGAPTDESAAIEALGFRPKLVEGSPLNIKVTRPSDLRFAEVALALLEESR